jgi:hypothetical protein
LGGHDGGHDFDYAKAGCGKMIDRVSDKVLKKHTGKIWKEWLQILNKAGAKHWNHQEIVAFLKTKHKQSTWWRQVVANGFEVSTGKRIAGQSLKGTYSATITKSVGVDHKIAWKWICSLDGVNVWLRPMSPLKIKTGETFEIEGGIFGEIRTLKAPQRIRFSWQDLDWDKATVVQLNVFKRDKNKCLLVLSHEGLKTARQKAEMHARWRQTIEEIAQNLAI